MRYTIVLLFVLGSSCLLISCDKRNTKEEIRDLAKKHEYNSPVNKLLEGYIRAYYATPPDKDHFLSFVQACELKDDYIKQLKQYGGYEIVEALFDNHSLFASFSDSTFIVMRKGAFNKMGCCVIGTPSFWLEHPEKYPMDRLDYNDWFNPAAFTANGEYLFPLEFDYSRLKQQIDSISILYYDSLVIHKDVIDLSSTNLDDPLFVKQWLPLRIVVSYELSSDYISMQSVIPNTGVYYTNSQTAEPLPLQTETVSVCRNYLDDIKQIFRTCLMESPKAESIITTIVLKKNE